MCTVIQICVSKLIRKKTGSKNVNMLAEVIIFDYNVLTSVSWGVSKTISGFGGSLEGLRPQHIA